MTRIFLDSGDPAEAQEALSFLNSIDGQTTNPSLVAKNPEAQARLESGNKFSRVEVLDFYKKIVQKISKILPQGSISVEVYADQDTSKDAIIRQAEAMNAWIPNAHIKIPITVEGLKAAEILSQKGIRLNLTLCFSQEQAAAVYAATKGAKKGDIFISPFIGRLDDRGENGINLIKNILKMYAAGDGHVEVLAASLRNLGHLTDSIALGCDIITAPKKVLKEWAQAGKPEPDEIKPKEGLGEIEYKELDLEKNWQDFNIQHDLTDNGLERFKNDWDSIIEQK